VDSPRDLEVLVTGSDGRVRPSSGAAAEVGKVLFERGLLFVDVSKLVGDARRDAREKFSVLARSSTRCWAALAWSVAHCWRRSSSRTR